MTQEIIQKMRNELNARLIERTSEIDIILACLVSGQHAFLFGPPGCGKSLMIRILRDMIGEARYFEILMAASTRPIELCGPPSLAKLSEGEYHVETDGYLPWAHIAFLDEIWKANSAILNTLLTLINERRFKNGKNIDKTPLISLFGASNELPEDASLGALDDRFVARLVINPVGSREDFKAIMRMNRKRGASASVLITLDEIRACQAKVAEIPVSDEFDDALYDVRTALFKEFGPSFILSERRLAMISKLAQGLAFILGDREVTPKILPMLVCCFWKELPQIPIIQNVLDAYLSVEVKKFQKEVMVNVLPRMLAFDRDLAVLQTYLYKSARGEPMASLLSEIAVSNSEIAVYLKQFFNEYEATLSDDASNELASSEKVREILAWMNARVAYARVLFVYFDGQVYDRQPNIPPAPNKCDDLKVLLG